MKRLLTGVACLAVVGCAGATSAVVPGRSPSVLATDYYPLQVGTAWRYEVNMLGSLRTLEVKLMKETNGMVEDSTGAHLIADDHGVRDEKRYLLRNPVEPGTQWTNVVSVSSVEHYRILSSREPCQTEAGSWANCVLVQGRNRVDESKTLVNEMTFAPGVGLVRVSTTLETQGRRIPQSSVRLLAFTPATPGGQRPPDVGPLPRP